MCLFNHCLVVFVAGWNEKCGAWTSDPYNDYCYLFNYLSQRTWAEARADCVNQGGELVSVTDLYEQAFVQGVTFTPLLQHPDLIISTSISSVYANCYHLFILKVSGFVPILIIFVCLVIL